MRGNAEGFNHDLRAASLANLHVQLGRLADDNIIRLHISADFPCKFVLVTEFLHDVHYQVLLSAVAGSLNHLGCEGQEFLRPFLV